MIKISISGESRPLTKASRNWIRSRMHNIRKTGKFLSVQVAIDEGPLDIILSSGEARLAGEVANYSSKEKEVIEMWKEERMHTQDFDSENLCEFLYRVSQCLW